MSHPTQEIFTDSYSDRMHVRLDGEKLHIKAVQNYRHDGPKEANLSFKPEVAEQLRDHLIKLFPLPAVTGETSLESVGDLTTIRTSSGGIVINATGNVIINQK